MIDAKNQTEMQVLPIPIPIEKSVPMWRKAMQETRVEPRAVNVECQTKKTEVSIQVRRLK